MRIYPENVIPSVITARSSVDASMTTPLTRPSATLSPRRGARVLDEFLLPAARGEGARSADEGRLSEGSGGMGGAKDSAFARLPHVQVPRSAGDDNVSSMVQSCLSAAHRRRGPRRGQCLPVQ